MEDIDSILNTRKISLKIIKILYEDYTAKLEYNGKLLRPINRNRSEIDLYTVTHALPNCHWLGDEKPESIGSSCLQMTTIDGYYKETTYKKK